MLCKHLQTDQKSSPYGAADVNDHVRRIVASMPEYELTAIEVAQFANTARIKEHIKHWPLPLHPGIKPESSGPKL